MNKFIKSTTSLAVLVLAVTLFSCSDDEKIYGLNSSAKYGNIKVTFTGTRPDDEPFQVTNNYRFMPEEGPQFSHVDTDGFNYFSVQRQHGAVNENHNNNYFGFYLTADGDAPIDENEFYAETYIFTGDNTYINFNFETEFNADEITAFSYDEEKGKLTLEFTSTISGDLNPTGNELTITVQASVTVFRGPVINIGG